MYIDCEKSIYLFLETIIANKNLSTALVILAIIIHDFRWLNSRRVNRNSFFILTNDKINFIHLSLIWSLNQTLADLSKCQAFQLIYKLIKVNNLRGILMIMLVKQVGKFLKAVQYYSQVMTTVDNQVLLQRFV